MTMPLLQGTIIYAILFSSISAWSVTMPKISRGLRGSCLVIPCSYYYTSYPPANPSRIVWYQYVDRGYPLVYDSWYPESVIWKFRGRTSLYGNSYERDCSLQIDDLSVVHHGEKLYTWIDPENVGSGTYTFYDVTTEIHVDTYPEEPSIDFFGASRVGETIKVRCSTFHSCPSNKPILMLIGVEKKQGTTDSLSHTYIGNGKWKVTLTREVLVKSERQSVMCTATHNGGMSALATKIFSAQCPIYEARITPTSSTELLEGVERDIICSVTYSCPKDRPYIIWDNGQLPGRTSYETQRIKQEAISVLKLTPKASDQGKVITCQVDFKGQVQRVQITLRIKRSMSSLDWTFSMPNTITGVRGSCVVIPCSFDFKTSQSSPFNVKWYKFSNKGYLLAYDQSSSNIIDLFKGKTSLYGSANERNCSLKINPIEMQHNQERLCPWMDPKPIDSYHREKYYDKTISLGVTEYVDKPDINIIGLLKVGEQITLSCSVLHTCPPAPPTLSLSISRGVQRTLHMPQHDGKWETTIEVTWTLQEDDTSVTCSVRYPGGQTSEDKVSLNPLCDFQKPEISPTQEEVMEGVEKVFTCTVLHTCKKRKPNVNWNYQNMPVSTETRKNSSNAWKTISTLTFKAKVDDNGKHLTCTAHSVDDETSNSVLLKVKRGMSSLDWTYSMPNKIKGLRGSCLVIPCSFEFKTATPRKIDMKWYQYSTTEYPLVYDSDVQNVIGKFWKKTRLSEWPSTNNCSLEINTLEMDHNKDRLYPWMDPQPVESFHRENSVDNSVELQITEQPDKPKLSIIGIPIVGEQITVSCSVQHTCPISPPSLFLGKSLETDRTEHTPNTDGIWETIRHHTFAIKEDEQTVTCKATFSSGQTSEAQINLNAKCIHKDMIIEPEVADVTEGVAKNFTCTAFHSCKSQPPTLTWNYKDMPESTLTKKGPALTWGTYSNISFLASLEDNGKQLICTAEFPDGKVTTSVVLQVQKYIPKVVDPFENDTLYRYEADVVPKITALTDSCVVIPCTFNTGDEHITRLRGLWYSISGEYVYHTGQTNVMDNFKGRTKLLGNPDEKNCTLEIDEVQPHDNGPFCFHAEKGSDKYRFNHSCVFIIMRASPNKPVISALPEEMEPGKRFTISCSVNHTCISHPPTLTWNVPIAREEVKHVEGSAGQWETISTITFIPTGYEKEEDLICSASLWGGKKQESSIYLSVRRFEGLGMDIIGPCVTVPLVLFLLIIIGVVIYKRRVRRNTSNGDRTGGMETRRSVWNQFSRRFDGTANWLNSIRGTRTPARPPKPEKRRSVWDRFSRRRPDTSEDLTVQYNVRLNNPSAVDGDRGFSKPRFPSPKSASKSYSHAGGGHCTDNSDIYMNTDCRNFY